MNPTDSANIFIAAQQERDRAIEQIELEKNVSFKEAERVYDQQLIDESYRGYEYDDCGEYDR